MRTTTRNAPPSLYGVRNEAKHVYDTEGFSKKQDAKKARDELNGLTPGWTVTRGTAHFDGASKPHRLRRKGGFLNVE
jgi:hypothetical protein